MKLISLFVVGLILSACGAPPRTSDILTLDADHLARREMTTRRFNTDDERGIMSASIHVIQDLGFIVDESESKFGLITATRRSSIGNTWSNIGHGFATIGLALLGVTHEYDKEQTIHLTLVTNRSRSGPGYNVRIDMARTITTNEDASRSERVSAPEMYQQFFDKLSQSLFLTAHGI